MEKNEKHWALGLLATCGLNQREHEAAAWRAGEVAGVRPLLDSFHCPTATSPEGQLAFPGGP